MAKLALEVHDCGLLAVADDDPRIRVESPGVALWSGGRLVMGASAEARSRLHPKDVHRRFWQNLSLAPLGPPFPSSWTVAELVHAHLEAVWQEVRDDIDSVLVVVGGAFSSKQLGLLLGIARSLKMPVRGLVDTALSAALPVAFDLPRGRLLHLDLHQHRAVLTEIERRGELERGRIEVDDSVGWVDLQDTWARHIASVFIQSTRFDPLYNAELEQILYHQMSRWLAELKRSEVTIPRLEGPSGEMSVELERDATVAAADEAYNKLVRLVQRVCRQGDEPTTLLLSSHAARLPLLAERLQRYVAADVSELEAAAAARGALLGRSAVEKSAGEAADDETLPYVVRLPAEADKSGPIVRPVAAPTGGPQVGARGAVAGDEASDSETPAPTHLLHLGVAYPVSTEPFVLGTQAVSSGFGLKLTGAIAGISRRHLVVRRRGGRLELEDHSTYGTWVQNERVNGRRVLAVGDRIRLGSPGIEVQVIRVTGHDGAAP